MYQPKGTLKSAVLPEVNRIVAYDKEGNFEVFSWEKDPEDGKMKYFPMKSFDGTAWDQFTPPPAAEKDFRSKYPNPKELGEVHFLKLADGRGARKTGGF